MTLTRPYVRGNVHVKAVQLTQDNFWHVYAWADSKPFYGPKPTEDMKDYPITGLTVFTLTGRVKAEFGDWVWQTTAGDFDVCPDAVFSQYFKAVEVAR